MSSSLQNICWSLSLLVVPIALEAQFISLKTVPIASGEQFLIFPSSNLGMGGISLAINDPMLDPYVNPAKGARLTSTHLYGTPTFYSNDNDQGGARTLPAGMLFTNGGAFGGLSAAVQQVDRGNRGSVNLFLPNAPPGLLLRERVATNTYLFGMLGGRLGGGTSVAASMSYSDLNVVDGVDRLYAQSQNVVQRGHVTDLRLGILREMEGDRALEASLVHARTRMRHDVVYVDWRWDPVGRQSISTVREELNLDRTNTYGAHLGYRRPLYDTGWKAGGIVTVNYKTHPKIPNYEIQNIPRDPGHSWAYNFGVGVSKEHDGLTYGADLIYEPVWSHTWAEAGTPTRTVTGSTIPVGGRTVENDFIFSNKTLRMGVGRDYDRGGWQAGLGLKRIKYALEQVNLVQGTQRDQDEAWTEVSPTWSGVLKFPEFVLRYSGYVSTNNVNFGFGEARNEVVVPPSIGGVDFIAAPSGTINMADFTVLVHQFSVSIPLKF